MNGMNTVVQYRDAPGFPGYRVGSDGSVWNSWINCRSGRRRTERWKRLKLAVNDNGYLSVNLTPPGRPYRTVRVHRLVLEAFVGPCPEGMECRHYPDQNKQNNNLENLSWGTRDRNVADNIEVAKYVRGSNHPTAMLNEEQVVAIRTRYAAGGVFQRELAAEFGITISAVSMIVNNRCWKHL